MSRKKSRKAGLIGVRKDPDFKKKRKVEEKRVKKTIGKPAGSRHNPNADENPKNHQPGQIKDKRVGSKKPIALIKQESPKTQEPRKKYFSPAQELETIESDELMNQLLDKLDAGKKLSAEHKQYLDQKLARHKVLCELLGINAEEEPEADNEVDADLYQQFESSNLDDFK